MGNTLFENIFLKCPTAMILINKITKDFYINEAFTNILGLAKDIIDIDYILNNFKTITSNKFEYDLSSKFNIEKHIIINKTDINIDNLDYVLLSIDDITQIKKEQLKIKRERDSFNQVLDNIPDIIFYKDVNGVYKGCNKACSNLLLGKPPKDVIGKTDFELIPNQALAKKCVESDKKIISTRNPIVYDTTMRCSSTNVIKDMESKKVPLIDDNDNVVGVIGIVRDITTRKQMEEHLKIMSFTDELTGLYNRNYFEQMASKLNTSKYMPLSLIMGDVNGLKIVNDTFGHLEGDKLIINIANTIKEACRKEDLIFRWGGDEIAILLPNTTKEDASKVLERINLFCEQKENKPIPLSISMGFSSVSEVNDCNISNMIVEADTLLYKSKSENKNYINAKILEEFKKYINNNNIGSTILVQDYSATINKYKL